MSLPSGTVTFLFTDIEGSTKLWEQNPERMAQLLARHDMLVRDAVEKYDGLVFKTVGDAFCTAFHTANLALEAALASQLKLTEAADGDAIPFRTRMALHTGSVECRDDDYFGQPVNRVARLLVTGHGGQILVSEVTRGLCLDALPPDCTLKPLGGHRLKDLGRPEYIYQLCHPKLGSDFPNLRSLENLPNNLPEQPTSFVGRHSEIVKIKGLLDRSRLLTLTGSGGCGKTRLALQVAAEMLDGSGEGVWLVELGAVPDGSLVPQAVAEVLGVNETTGKPIQGTLIEHLRASHILLVLDNCEHLLAACASLADGLLHRCPQVLILATSREGLGIGGETTYRVPSLSLPEPGSTQTPESLGQCEAVRLFIERAAQVHPGFQVTNENAPAVASICHRLDGIPLAVELAAARIRSMSVAELKQQLDRSFRLLTGGSRTSLPRQQTLRSLIDWSYDLLAEPERALLRRVSVFSGGWSAELVEQICSGDGIEEEEVLPLLSSLVDKSLVTTDEKGGTTRYRLLETVGQYARDRLREAGEDGSWRDRHLRYFVLSGEAAEPHLTGADQRRSLERLEAEHDNLRAALGWSTKGIDPEQGLRLVAAIWRFWHLRGHFAEGATWLKTILACADGNASSEVRARALYGAGMLAIDQCDYAFAQAELEESLQLRRDRGDLKGVAACLNVLGMAAIEQGDATAAEALHQESLSIKRELGDRAGIAMSLANLGDVAAYRRDFLVARELHEESLCLARELGDRWVIGVGLTNLGNVATMLGNPSAAAPLLSEALTIGRELGDPRGIAFSLEGLALAECLLENFERSVLLWSAAAKLRGEIGSPLPPRENEKFDLIASTCRPALGGDFGFDLEWKRGKGMSMDQAIEFALAEAAV